MTEKHPKGGQSHRLAGWLNSLNVEKAFMFPAYNFRKFTSPYGFQTLPITKYSCFVQISDIPEALDQCAVFEEYQLLNQQNEQLVRKWMLERTPYLYLKVRPIVLNVGRASFDNRKNKLHIVLDDPEGHGVVAGLLALRALLKNRGQCNNNQYVEFSIMEGIPVELLREFSFAQNI